MDMLKLAGFALVGALMAMLLRRFRPEAGMAASLGAGVVMSTLILPQLGSLIRGVIQIADAGGVSGEYMSHLLKVCGISLLMDFSAQTCRDAGEEGLAVKVEMGGRVVLLTLALPFMQALLQQIMSLAS